MRPLLLALAAALALAGCFGDGDDTPAPPSPSPSPDATPTPEATPSPTPTPTATPTPTPEAPAPEPQEVVNETFDFTSGDATGQAPHDVPFEVPEGFATLAMDISTTPKDVGGNPLSLGTQANIVLLDPTGKEVAEWSGAEDEPVTAEFPATPGAWTLRFEGVGSNTAHVRGVVSG